MSITVHLQKLLSENRHHKVKEILLGHNKYNKFKSEFLKESNRVDLRPGEKLFLYGIPVVEHNSLNEEFLKIK